jgi:hypothetical protein
MAQVIIDYPNYSVDSKGTIYNKTGIYKVCRATVQYQIKHNFITI